jgi:hypothetical protein
MGLRRSRLGSPPLLADAFEERIAEHAVRLGRSVEIPDACIKLRQRGIPPSSTEVEITLEEADGATFLRLVHRGLPAGEVESHTGGWEFFLHRLAARLAQRAA